MPGSWALRPLPLLEQPVVGHQLHNCPRTGSLTGGSSDPESRPAQSRYCQNSSRAASLRQALSSTRRRQIGWPARRFVSMYGPGGTLGNLKLSILVRPEIVAPFLGRAVRLPDEKQLETSHRLWLGRPRQRRSHGHAARQYPPGALARLVAGGGEMPARLRLGASHA